MPEFSEQDRPYEPVSEGRKRQWFDGLMSRALTKGVHLTPEDFGHQPSKTETSLPMSRYECYAYTFTYEELIRAGIDPAWAMVELNFGLDIHSRDKNILMPYVSLMMRRLVVWDQERTVIMEQSISLSKESSDHIVESLDLPRYRDSSEASLGREQIQDIASIIDLDERTGMRQIDPILAQQLDRLSQLD